MPYKSTAATYALKIAVPYLILGGLWILLSDKFLERSFGDVQTLTTFQTYKGWFFVLMSATLVYITSRHYLKRLARTQEIIRERDNAMTENQRGILTLLANLPGMAYRGTYDDDRHMEFLSEGCTGLTGYEPDVFAGQYGEPFASVIVQEDREMVRREMSRAVRDKSAFQVEYRIRTKYGRVKWVSEHGCAIRSGVDDKNTLVGYMFELDSADRKSVRSRKSNALAAQPAGKDISQGINIQSRNF